MSDLSSSSTLAQVQDAYDDNASYAEDASVSKGRLFVTACRILLRRLPAMAAQGDSTLTLQENLRQIRSAMSEARSWLKVNDSARTGPSVTAVNFANFR